MQASPTPLRPLPYFSLGHCTSGLNRRFIFVTPLYVDFSKSKSIKRRLYFWNPPFDPGARGGKSWKEEALASVCSGRLLISL